MNTLLLLDINAVQVLSQDIYLINKDDRPVSEVNIVDNKRYLSIIQNKTLQHNLRK